MNPDLTFIPLGSREVIDSAPFAGRIPPAVDLDLGAVLLSLEDVSLRGVVADLGVPEVDHDGDEVDHDGHEVDLDGDEVDHDSDEVDLDGGEVDHDSDEVDHDGHEVDLDGDEVDRFTVFVEEGQ